jgi:GAF domain-containing protein
MSDLVAIVHNLNRLAALERTGLMDSPIEEPFDRLTRLAARIIKAPMALVSLVDRDRQFFKSAVGLPEPWRSRRETPLSYSFCQHVVARHEPVVIPDARKDPTYRDNPAIRELGIVAYCGVPITTLGHSLGAFCVIDEEPRTWSYDDVQTLKELGDCAIRENRSTDAPSRNRSRPARGERTSQAPPSLRERCPSCPLKPP